MSVERYKMKKEQGNDRLGLVLFPVAGPRFRLIDEMLRCFENRSWSGEGGHVHIDRCKVQCNDIPSGEMRSEAIGVLGY
jgi:hypothetical protein